MGKPTVFVCGECRGRRALVEVLQQAGVKVEKVGCQKLCDGPVAGASVKGRLEWFGELHKHKHHRALAELAAAGDHADVPAVLERHLLKKRSGRKAR